MTFITKPTEEGETKECPNCDVSLIARWTDYKGQYEDKLQWQTVEPRKSHYTKTGDCKGETPEQAENQASSTAPKNKSTTPKTEGEPRAIPIPGNDIQYIKNKVDLMFAMISEQYKEYIDRKNTS